MFHVDENFPGWSVRWKIVIEHCPEGKNSLSPASLSGAEKGSIRGLAYVVAEHDKICPPGNLEGVVY